MLTELAAANAAYATISKFIANGLIKIWKIYLEMSGARGL